MDRDNDNFFNTKSIYSYKDNEYKFLGFTGLKCPQTGKWFKAVKYGPNNSFDGVVEFVREEKDFRSKFKVVSSTSKKVIMYKPVVELSSESRGEGHIVLNRLYKNSMEARNYEGFIRVSSVDSEPVSVEANNLVEMSPRGKGSIFYRDCTKD